MGSEQNEGKRNIQEEKAGEDLAQQNLNLRFLNDTAFHLAQLTPEQDIKVFLCTRLKEFTGAAFVTYSEYNHKKRVLKTRHIETDQKILQTIINTVDKNILNTESPVSEEIYQELIHNVVIQRNSLSDITFGAIPKIADFPIKTLTRTDRFYRICYVIAGKIFGTSVIGMKKGQNVPSTELFESFANLAAITLRRENAEDALRQNEERFRSYVENSSDIIYLLSPEGIFTYVSPQWTKLLGYPVNQIVGQLYETFIHPEDVIQTRSYLERVILSGESQGTIDYRIRHLDGSYKWHSSNTSIIHNDKGEVTSYLGIARDITEQKDAAEEQKKYYLRLNKQNATIIKLATDEHLTKGNLEGFFNKVTEAVAETIKVSRASIWLFQENESQLMCANLYELPMMRHSPGQILHANNYPEFFKKLRTNLVVAVNDILSDILTPEFKNNYLLPLGIKSLLNATFRVSGKVLGILCLSHTGETRIWHEDEVFFANQVADQIAIAIMNHENTIIRESLARNEKKYRSYFENVQDVFYQTDMEGQIVEISPSIQRYSNYTREELIGKTLESIYVDPKDRESLLKEIQVKGEVFDYEVKLFNKHHKIFWASANAHFFYDNDGKILGIEGSLRDITERKQVEETLKRERILLRTLIDNLPDTVYIKDAEARKLIANLADVEVTGYNTEAEILYKTDLEIYDPIVGAHGYNEDMRVLKTGKPLLNEESAFPDSKSGNLRWLQTSKIPLFDESGNIIGLVGIGHDVTKRRQIEEALRVSEEKYRTLIESIPDGVYRSTPEGKLLEVNPALVKIFGYDSREDLMSINIKTDLYFDINDRESAILKEKKEEMAIYPLRKKDGSRIWVEDHGWVKTDEQGNILQYEGVLRDVTERVNAGLQLKKYADELKIANDTKDKLFSIIGHDLRSPFTILMGYAGLLSDDYEEYSEEERKDMIKHIKDAAENNFLLLENLLTWSRSQRGQIKVNAVKTDIGNISIEIIGILNPVAAAKNIQLTNKITPGTFAWADTSMVHTILLNLTNNAIKFTNSGGLVIIEAGISGDKIQVSVKDNGVGMAQEEVKNIFRLDATHSTPGTANEKGTGLGLLICKEFAEKLGGTIWVESEPGKGSTFIFTLPVSQD